MSFGGLGLARRRLSSTASQLSAARWTDDRVVRVSYADQATIRRRLALVAQDVLGMLDTRTRAGPLPQLSLPAGSRVRHGFWFMKFDREGLRHAARCHLDAQPYASECGTLRGTLRVDNGTSERHLRAMLAVEGDEGAEAWLTDACNRCGPVESVHIPRLQCNWDPGHAFVRYGSAEHALRALEELDGTPSCVVGCNLHVRMARRRPLVLMTAVDGAAIAPDDGEGLFRAADA